MFRHLDEMNEVPDTVTVQAEDRRLFVKRKTCIQVLNDLSHLTLLFICSAAKTKQNKTNKQTAKIIKLKANLQNNNSKTKQNKCINTRAQRGESPGLLLSPLLVFLME